jgi:hypothetical protein
MAYTGFHAEIRTGIEEEISLAESLYIACLMRYGDRRTRMLRTDPAKVFSMMRYARIQPSGEREFIIWQGNGYGRNLGCRRPSNDEILTPSHERWPEFLERLGAELLRPDFDFWYAPQRFKTNVGVTAEFWPLCSAELIGEIGCAIAESLCLLTTFYASDDAAIYERAERIWHNVKPHSKRRAFDADGTLGADAAQTDTADDDGR